MAKKDMFEHREVSVEARFGGKPLLFSAAVPWREDVSQEPGGPSMTRQEFTAECDINEIMKRYPGGQLPPLNYGPDGPMYLDLTQSPESLLEAMNTMRDAETAFMSLPAEVRKEFQNDPMEFVSFAADPENLDQLREWKLAPPAPVEPGPVKVELVNPPPAAPAK